MNFFLLVGLHLKPLNIKISQVNERVRSLKNCRGGAGKLKCRFEVWVQGRKVESWMQVQGFEGCVCSLGSWESYGGGDMLLLPPDVQLLT